VCGEGARALVAALSGKEVGSQPRVARLARDGRAADQVMVRSAAGFTGEETVEITCHGGPAVVERVFDLLGLARAGATELLERGVETGALDRIQAEAWAFLPGAVTELAARTLQDQAGGALSRAVSALRSVDGVRTLLETAPLGRALARPPRIVLAGRPNAGKSTLFNALVDADRAIVSPVAGTTRDPVRERISIDGVPFELVDTAGVGEPGDDLERMAIDRTRKALGEADLVLELVGPGEPPSSIGGPRRILVAGKADLASGRPSGEALPVSGKTGLGLQELRRRILDSFGIRPTLPEGAPAIFTPRQEGLLVEAAAGRLPLEEARRRLLRGPAAS